MNHKAIKLTFKITKTLVFVLLTLFLIVQIFSRNKKTTFVLNHSPMVVMTASMEPEFRTNSFVIIKRESISDLNVGDVIAFKSDALNGALAFHRIIKITNAGVFTKGDNNNLEDNQAITEDTYVGKCIYNTNFGARYLTYIKRPVGFVILFLLPALTLAVASWLFSKLLSDKEKRGCL